MSEPSAFDPYGRYRPDQGWPSQTPPLNGPAQGQPPANQPWQFDPANPVGPQPSARVDIRQYAAPRASTPVLVGLVAFVVLLGVVFAGFFLKGGPGPAASARPSASASASSRSGMPFAMPLDPSSTGTWEILDRQWTSEGVTVHVRIAADAGRVSYAFIAFPNSGTEAVRPVPGARSPELTSGVLNAGEATAGYVFLPLKREAATLILTTSAGRQISALPIAV